MCARTRAYMTLGLVCAAVDMWRLEDNHVDPEDCTQVIRLAGRHRYPLRHLITQTPNPFIICPNEVPAKDPPKLDVGGPC